MKKWILWFCILLLCILPVSAAKIPLTDGDGASVLLYCGSYGTGGGTGGVCP